MFGALRNGMRWIKSSEGLGLGTRLEMGLCSAAAARRGGRSLRR